MGRCYAAPPTYNKRKDAFEGLMFKKFIGDRAFYRHMAVVAIPIVIQNAITNFVSLLDNIMVGQIGTLEMSGVSIANQLVFVFNICVWLIIVIII